MAFRAAAAGVPSVGERPQGAVVVDSVEAVPVCGRGGVCSCGGEWRETERVPVLYDGRSLLVVTRRCERCAADKALYFRAVERG